MNSPTIIDKALGEGARQILWRADQWRFEKTLWRRMERKESGQSLVEFALLLPVFILAVMMIVDLGRVVYYYSVVYNAAREGARYGVVDQDPAKIDELAMHLASGILEESDIDSQVITVTGTYLEQYDAIEVVVTYDFTAATPFLGRLTGSPGNNIVLRSKATMRLEEQ